MDESVDPQTIQSLNDFFASVGIVSGIALFIAVPAFLVMRQAGQPFLPRWRSPGVSRTSAGVLLSFFPVMFVVFHVAVTAVVAMIERGYFPAGIKTTADTEGATRQLRLIWAAVLMTPFIAAGYWLIHKLVGTPKPRAFARNALLGIGAWAVLVPLTFTVYVAVKLVFQWLGLPEIPHPLMELKPANDGTGGILFAVGVCVCTPICEECLFRGLLVPWASQRRMFPWVLMFAAFLLVVMASPQPLLPSLFIAFLCGLLLVVQLFAPRKHLPRRTTACIIASSAAFAAAHSAVWPTPIPLFVLALGLGYLTARTRSIVPSVVVHGLFNAVSFAMLCRGTPV